MLWVDPCNGNSREVRLMASIYYVVTVRDNSASPPGTRMTGLSPSWVFLSKLSGGSLTGPTISEIGDGQYMFSFDPEANGEASGQIDAGSTLAYPSDRYIDVLLTLDSSRVQAALTANGANVNLGQSFPSGTNYTADTMGRALQLARADARGKWTLVSDVLTLYDTDNATVVATFNMTPSGGPYTQRLATTNE